MFDKNIMIRIAADNDALIIDKEQKIMSRGAYVCNNTECIEKIPKRKNLKTLLNVKMNEDFVKEILQYAK